MAGYSSNELLEWMKLKSQTLGWDALLVINRSKLNHILRADYIDHFNNDSYFPPISGEAPIRESQREVLYDVVLDSPRLAFNQADLKSSAATAEMRILGGVQITMEYAQGVGWPIRVDSIDPLDGPTLEMTVDLTKISGTISGDRTAVVDLANSYDFRLTYPESEEVQQKLGEFFKDRFSTFPANTKLFKLATFQEGGDEYLAPENFEIRTQASGETARIRQSEDFGDGAVLLFVTMHRGGVGGFPGSDFRYLIPNDAGKEYSATLLLNHRLVSRALMVEGFKTAFNRLGIEWHESYSEENKLLSITSDVFGFVDNPVRVNGPGIMPSWYVNIPALCINKYSSGGFKIDFSGEHVILTWHTIVNPDAEHKLESSQIYDPFTFNCQYYNNASYRFVEANGDNGGVALVAMGPVPAIEAYNVPLRFPDRVELTVRLAESVGRQLGQVLNTIGNLFTRWWLVETFLSSQIRIPFGGMLEYDAPHLADDIALFGKVSPSLTAFSIDPLEIIIGHGTTYSFKTTPHVNELQWTVAHTPGGTGAEGTIDRDTGVYFAPDQEHIQKAYLRVKVTAVAKNGYSSTALVSIVVRSITVNPLIQVCHAYDASRPDEREKRQFFAGSLDSGALRFDLVGPSDGFLSGNGGPRNGHDYLAMSKVSTAALVLEEIRVTNLISNKSQSSFVLVKHVTTPLEIKFDASKKLLSDQVQMQAFLQGNLISVGWAILTGPGSIAADGMYTDDPQSRGSFVIITATMPFAGTSLWGYLIVALPLDTFSNERKNNYIAL